MIIFTSVILKVKGTGFEWLSPSPTICHGVNCVEISSESALLLSFRRINFNGSFLQSCKAKVTIEYISFVKDS